MRERPFRESKGTADQQEFSGSAKLVSTIAVPLNINRTGRSVMQVLQLPVKS